MSIENRLSIRATAAAYNEFAREFAAHSDADRDWVVLLIEAFQRVVPAGGHILDLGCANGREMVDLAGAGFEVAGIDIAVDALKIGRRRLPHASFIVGDAVYLPFKAQSFDGVWASASLLHLAPEPAAAALREIARVLRSGGGLYCSVQSGDTRGFVPGRSVKSPLYYCYWRAGEWAELVSGAGLSVVELWETPWNPSCNEGADGWINLTATA